jgi:membrane-associated phospholipid phosphatase
MHVSAHLDNAPPLPAQVRHLAKTIWQNLFPSSWLWALTLALALGEVIAFHVGNKFLVDYSDMLSTILLAASASAMALLHARQPASSLLARLLRWCMMIVYLIPTILMLALLGYLVMANENPWMEASLLRWDQALGFDWLAYAEVAATHPVLNRLLSLGYHGMIPLLLLAASEAILRNENGRAAELISLVFLTGIAVTVVGAFFPAVSAMDICGNEELKKYFPPGAGNSFMQELREVRGSIPKLIHPPYLTGLIGFPSFHTVCGVLAAYGARGVAWRFWPIALFSALLIAATPIYGGHYLVDLLAGAAIAFGSILISQFLQARIRTTQP